MKSSFFTFILTALFLATTFSSSSAQTLWTKDTLNNPVLDPGPSGAWDAGFVGIPSVLFDGDTYHMWYSNGKYANSERSIGYATSPNGITWTKYDDPTTTSLPFAESDPVLIPGPPGAWDDEGATASSVLLLDTTYHMWYGGSDDPSDNAHEAIGYAKSTDGINWEKDTLNNPVLSPGSPGTWDDVWIYAPCVIFNDSIYHMWYMAHNGIGQQVRICHATLPHPDSSWTKDPNNPVLSYEVGMWDYPRVDFPNVIYDGNTYHMWYSGGDAFAWRIGYATSPDGSIWTRDAGNPVLDWGSVGSWDDAWVGICSVILEDSSYKMWYTGGNGVWDGHIGYTTSDIIDGIEGYDITYIPEEYSLLQNYPNPFNPTTTIEFDLPRTSEVTLKVFNILGEEVATLVSDRLSTGSYSYEWSRTGGIASGVYLYRLQAGDYVETRKMVLMR